MSVFFTAGFLLCLGYWIVATSYAGQFLAQSQIWLCFAFLSLCNAAVAWGYRHEWRQIPLWLVTAVHTATFSLAAVLIAAGVCIASGMHPGEPVNPEYVIVLGAQVRPDGTISRSLKRRLDRTLAYAEQNPQTSFVLSGGQDVSSLRSEAEVMADYLCENGLKAERLLLEIQSKNTFENISYSRALIRRVRGEAEESESRAAFVSPVQGMEILSAESRPVRIAVLSSDYHLYRAMHIAKKQSQQQIYGIPVATDLVLFPHFMLRECAALLKDKFLGRL